MLKALISLCRLALFTLLFAVIVSFAVSNRGTVYLELTPLPYIAEIPLYILTLLSFGTGILVGLISATTYYRSAVVHIKRDLKKRDKEYQAINKQLQALETEQYARAQMQHHITESQQHSSIS